MDPASPERFAGAAFNGDDVAEAQLTASSVAVKV